MHDDKLASTTPTTNDDAEQRRAQWPNGVAPPHSIVPGAQRPIALIDGRTRRYAMHGLVQQHDYLVGVDDGLRIAALPPTCKDCHGTGQRGAAFGRLATCRSCDGTGDAPTVTASEPRYFATVDDLEEALRKPGSVVPLESLTDDNAYQAHHHETYRAQRHSPASRPVSESRTSAPATLVLLVLVTVAAFALGFVAALAYDASRHVGTTPQHVQVGSSAHLRAPGASELIQS